ncbi:MAG TPA: exonuclease SbcCD subunit D C-terminal domain-containing protein, partial [Trebonia sp.]
AHPHPPPHDTVLREAPRRIRAAAAARGNPRTVVLAHAWVAGGASENERQQDAAQHVSASERDISVGGIGYVPVSVFDRFSYVALGHLHGRRTLTERMRYSGSPLPYSFSERQHQKGSWLVEVGGAADRDHAAAADRDHAVGITDRDHASITAEWIPAPGGRRPSVLAGRIDDLLGSRQHDPLEADFLAVTLTDTARPEGAMERLRVRFPHILTLEFKPQGVTADPRSYGQKVKGRDDLDVAAEFVRHVRNTDADTGERELLEAAFAASRDAAARTGGES